MTKKELIKELKSYPDDNVVVCMDEHGGWDNIQRIKFQNGIIFIEFGGGSPFSDE